MTEKKMVVVDPEKIEWVDHYGVEQLPKGLWGKLLNPDEETGAIAFLEVW